MDKEDMVHSNNGLKTETDISPKKTYTDGQQAHEKRFITNQ